ncbi:MAG: SUF system NifU family Fe-S cluster assembly protein, partial [Chamaesiphon sp.]|nr:SUF system NifU family Fe-S cluster assembly protein [Chamaesiphon sp.]
MNTTNLRDLYQQVILEHYKKPKHRGKTTPIDRYQKGHNPSCGDTIELTLQLDPSGERIADIQFEGEGCAIAMASVDLMAGAIAGKTIDEALELVKIFQGMMKGETEFPQEQRKLNVPLQCEAERVWSVIPIRVRQWRYPSLVQSHGSGRIRRDG